MQHNRNNYSQDPFYSKCREFRLKVTPQRLAIYENLAKSKKHPSAEQVYKIVKRRFPNISLDTINRTLATFARIGLINVVENFGLPRRYDADITGHHHAHCIKCGLIYDIYDDKLDRIKIPAEIRRRFKITGKRVVFSGLCEKCSKRE